MKVKRIIAIMIMLVVCIGLLTACGKSWVCDWCKTSFTGTAYYDGFDYDTTLCRDCAVSYFSGFPINGYEKK